ncbi:phosphatidate cytidylyltransferase [Rhizobium sp. C1]|uniref:phosphatidate cytidylyltransferase n=1 Tax=Rhizobium sp. C1 TaxID=1349799 RepID=UPI001E2D0CC1|nr:phosphatidate cytidylyltransferase [Rhizobium sp. C1]MCD2177079.1 phosphatidate cytidylyltransferase [Rhizobium sp. C1]
MSEELRLRIVSAIVLAIVVLAATWLGGIYFAVLAIVIAILVYYEWTRITDARSRDPEAYWVGWGAIALIAFDVLVEEGTDAWNEYLWGAVALLFIYALIRAKNRWNPAGVVYAGLTGVSLAEIRGDDFTGFIAMIFIFAVVWGTDIAAYFTGRAIGGKKLARSISPGKTWSGAIGGAVAAVICGALVVLCYMKQVSLWTVALAFLLSVFSQVGDLFESFMKRRYKVKDSSHLIPGHGGVMDRIDGLVFACSGAFILKMLLSSWNHGVGTFILGAVSQ